MRKKLEEKEQEDYRYSNIEIKIITKWKVPTNVIDLAKSEFVSHMKL